MFLLVSQYYLEQDIHLNKKHKTNFMVSVQFSKICAFIVWMLLFSSTSFCQENADNFQKMVDVLPPPPNAAAISKAALFNLNKNTGAPNINIPLFNLANRKLNVPVSLAYTSTGIKVDEIASRVGMGWSLNAGGVVTRTLRGTPDEVNPRKYPTVAFGYNWDSYFFMKDIVESTNTYGYDSEPDLFTFSFNGVTGSFVFDETMNVVQIPCGNLKIEYNFGSSDWNFKITDSEGVAYYFGGENAVEKTKRTTTCGKSFDTPIATAWYLIKVQHLNGDQINLSYQSHTYSYDTGISETMYWGAPGGTGNCGTDGSMPAAGNNSSCKNKVTTYGVVLKQIYSTDQLIEFVYDEPRLDCDDVLLTEVRNKNKNDLTLISKFTLMYSQTLSDPIFNNQFTEAIYTPFFTDLYQYMGTGVAALGHHFVYNQKSKRPPRLSFSQDHWGFFNGKTNSTLIPRLNITDDEETRFPNATANREVDSAYSYIGTLSKIIYPTGGMDSIIYESNRVNKYLEVKPNHEFSCSVTGTGEHETVFNDFSFTLDENQEVKLEISVNCNLGTGNCDPVHQIGRVEILSFSGSVLFTTTVIQAGSVFTENIDLSPGNLKLRIYANGAAITTNAKLYFKRTAVSTGFDNKLVGGVRVKYLLSSDGSKSPIIKRYFYGELESLEVSSAIEPAHPRYHKYYNNRWLSTVTTGGNLWLVQCMRNIISFHSNTLMSLTLWGSGIMSYTTVVESNGENFEGGGILTRYYAQADRISDIAWQNEIVNAPTTNISVFYNGKITEETILKKTDNNIFPIKKIESIYGEDTRRYKVIPGYTVNQKYSFTLGISNPPCDPTNINVTPGTNISCYILVKLATESFDVARYDIISPWTNVISKIETIYDEEGNNPLITTTNYFYDNEIHLQLTSIESLNSKEETEITEYSYPHDYVGTQVYDDMIFNNIIINKISTRKSTNGEKVSKSKINYGKVISGNYLPISIESSFGDGELELNGTFDLYSIKDNLLQYTDKTGLITSIIWGYHENYPVAKVIGVSYQDILSSMGTGFEDGIQQLDGELLKTEINNIRSGFPAAQVTTLTYKPLVGITSITDINNNITTYQYDQANRLTLILDQDNNILKHNEYSYAALVFNKPLKLYFNEEISGSFNCLSCLPGFQGTSYVYTVPAKKHFSLISKEDADSKAAADLNIMGQVYANRNGTCSNQICNGIAYRMINCICTLGNKVCETSVLNPDGITWTNSFHYTWYDGYSSPSFTEILQPCSTAVDIKKIGCKCEKAIKWWVESNPISGTSQWECKFYYKWSDGSTSLPTYYYETTDHNCMVPD